VDRVGGELVGRHRRGTADRFAIVHVDVRRLRVAVLGGKDVAAPPRDREQTRVDPSVVADVAVHVGRAFPRDDRCQVLGLA
jgi:hypothetical protein